MQRQKFNHICNKTNCIIDHYQQKQYKVMSDTYLKQVASSPLYFTELSTTEFKRMEDNCIILSDIYQRKVKQPDGKPDLLWFQYRGIELGSNIKPAVTHTMKNTNMQINFSRIKKRFYLIVCKRCEVTKLLNNFTIHYMSSSSSCVKTPPKDPTLKTPPCFPY